MARPQVKRNFKYGDLFKTEQEVLESIKEEQELTYEDLDKYGIGNDYQNFLIMNDFKIFLSYNTTDIAYTELATKKMYINGNYPDPVITALIKHELGHFMIFATDEPYSKDDFSVRSLIVKEVYSKVNLTKYSLEFLMNIENVIQDIIIETINYPECVCETFSEYGLDKMGVKHQKYLDPITDIVREALKNQLALAEEDRGYVDSDLAEKMKDFLEQALNDAIATMESNTDKMLKKEAKEQLRKQIVKTKNKLTKQNQKLSGLNRLKREGKPIPDSLIERVKEQRDQLEANLDPTNLRDDLRAMVDKSKKKRDREIDKLEATKEALAKNPNPPARTETGPMSEAEDSGHSCSTYIPGNSTVEINNKMYQMTYTKLRNKIFKLKNIESPKKFDKGMLSDKDGSILSQRTTGTYTRTSKLEYDNTDMIMGKKKKRSSGVSILIGLDVSGSMSSQWVSKFNQTVKLLSSVSKSLQIQEPMMFTYGDHFGTMSNDDNVIKKAIEERSGGGGNAFGAVYEELIKHAPLSTYTEIILITDCGDNLGWDIQSPIKDVSDKELKMHCSVLDTDGSVVDRPDENWQKEYWSYFNTNNLNMSSIAKSIAKTIRSNK